jgi:hypothetical protein
MGVVARIDGPLRIDIAVAIDGGLKTAATKADFGIRASTDYFLVVAASLPLP